jgi:HAD superfamily hydrolase (TIGR01548 family)
MLGTYLAGVLHGRSGGAEPARKSERPDGIIFDCDGVLVDVAESYGATIVRTVGYVLDWLGMRGMPPLQPSVMQAFKDTGAFNNEVDLSYAAVLMMAASARARMDVGRAAAAFADCRGVRDADDIAAGLCDMSDVVARLKYPGTSSVVQEVFDQLFYGPDLYKKIAGRESRFTEPGLIERENILLDGATREWLTRKFGPRIGMVTGRGRESARHTLGDMMDMFNMAGSAFLEDEPRTMAKPNPESLVSAIDAMGISRCVYVGDSAEDLMMARAADRDVVFVGVWGTAPDRRRRQEMFLDRGADLTVKLITGLPRLLE